MGQLDLEIDDSSIGHLHIVHGLGSSSLGHLSIGDGPIESSMSHLDHARPPGDHARWPDGSCSAYWCVDVRSSLNIDLLAAHIMYGCGYD
jgi:hypothetical protein